MTDEKKTLKFQMMMSPREAEQLDDWMFRNRLRSRAEAIRRLCQIGLAFDDIHEDLGQEIDRYLDMQDDIERRAIELIDRVDAKEEIPATEILSALAQILFDYSKVISPLLFQLTNPIAEASMLRQPGQFEELFQRIEDSRKKRLDHQKHGTVDVLPAQEDD